MQQQYSELNSHICHRNTQVKSYIPPEHSKSFTTQVISHSPVLKMIFSLNQFSYESDGSWVISTATHRTATLYTELLPEQIHINAYCGIHP